jgi:uncharacterized repeat protein (TIGR03803 family)
MSITGPLSTLRFQSWKTFDLRKRSLALLLLCAAVAISSRAQTFTVVNSFDGTDGINPSALVQGTNGSLYGTTSSGGTGSFCPTAGRCGTVFRVTPSGEIITIYNFCSQSGCSDGYQPLAQLVLVNGVFYGTTYLGGTGSSCPGGPYCGTIFKLAGDGKVTTVHNFCSESDCADGSEPFGALVLGSNGNLYGTASGGGSHGGGTVFEFNEKDGDLSNLYNFCSQPNCTDGELPVAGLIMATNGYLYGTTWEGGAHNKGTLFETSQVSGATTTLYSFCSQSDCADGSSPHTPVVQATDGNIYGTTAYGGTGTYCPITLGCGTIFEIGASGGTLTTLHTFCSQISCSDGNGPWGQGLLQASDGEFYGTTNFGGGSSENSGTVFEIGPGGGELTTLATFCFQSSCDGSYSADPIGGLVQNTSGAIYGTTWSGVATGTCPNTSSSIGCGTVFKLSVGLGAFIQTQPVLGSEGTHVTILGTDLKGATRVTFNGTPASFKVVSAAEITTKVPPNATTGFVEVVTPGGTLYSNGYFQVP